MAAMSYNAEETSKTVAQIQDHFGQVIDGLVRLRKALDRACDEVGDGDPAQVQYRDGVVKWLDMYNKAQAHLEEVRSTLMANQAEDAEQATAFRPID